MNNQFSEMEDGSWSLELGEGNVMINWGHHPENPSFPCVSFHQVKESHEIGSIDPEIQKSWKPGCSVLDWDGYKPGLVIWFTERESIDVLIDALYKARSQFIHPVNLMTEYPPEDL
jgi:hypothetical protein